MKEKKPENTFESNTFSIMSMILGGIAFLLLPPFLGGAGVILAIIGKTKNEKLWAIGFEKEHMDPLNVVGRWGDGSRRWMVQQEQERSRGEEGRGPVVQRCLTA